MLLPFLWGKDYYQIIIITIEKMDKKNYMTPEMELITIDTMQLLSASAGAGINSDYSVPSGNEPSSEQPEEW